MLFGEKREFAIECEITDYVESFHFCRLRFFVNDEIVGDYDEQVTLGVCLFNAEIFLENSKYRLAPDTEAMTASQILSKFYYSLFNKDFYEVQMEYEDYTHRFQMQEIGGDSTKDNYAILLLRQSDGKERMVIKKITEMENEDVFIREAYFIQGQVDFVVRSFLNWGIQQQSLVQ